MGLPTVAIVLAITIVRCLDALQILGPKEQKLSEIGKMIFPEIAAKFGYPAEEKDVITEDGYILTMYHIPGNKTRSVLLVHGNRPTCDCWIIRGESSLAITLARQGYDVWAINLRGSRYSRRHQYLDPDTQPERFFNFSFYEQGIYDLPATVDLVLQETGQEQLLVIGHSVGTTLLYVMGSEKPEYNDKIKVGISLAPICFYEYARSVSYFNSVFGPVAPEALINFLNIHEVFAHHQVAPLVKAICLQPLGYEICIRRGLFAITGPDEKGLEPEFVPTLFGHFSGGSSVKTLRHIFQMIQKNKFIKYDYGKTKNLSVYNSSEPPQFDLSKVTMKSALFVGKGDFESSVQDSKRLSASLPNVVHFEVLPYDKFNHVDFIWGRYMSDNLYPYLFPVIEKYV